jgi:hypothetical protein
MHDVLKTKKVAAPSWRGSQSEYSRGTDPTITTNDEFTYPLPLHPFCAGLVRYHSLNRTSVPYICHR